MTMDTQFIVSYAKYKSTKMNAYKASTVSGRILCYGSTFRRCVSRAQDIVDSIDIRSNARLK